MSGPFPPLSHVTPPHGSVPLERGEKEVNGEERAKSRRNAERSEARAVLMSLSLPPFVTRSVQSSSRTFRFPHLSILAPKEARRARGRMTRNRRDDVRSEDGVGRIERRGERHE